MQPPVENPRQCGCGQPLHYPTPEIAAQTTRIVLEHGWWFPAWAGGEGWWVPKPYLASHFRTGGEAQAFIEDPGGLRWAARRHGWPKIVGRPPRPTQVTREAKR